MSGIVSSLSLYALQGCVNLSYIIVDASNATYASVNGVLFNKAIQQLLYYPSGKKELSYTEIPYSVNTIASYAFYKCKFLSSISVPTAIGNINDYSFDQCDNLTSVSFYGIIPNTTINNFKTINNTVYCLPNNFNTGISVTVLSLLFTNVIKQLLNELPKGGLLINGVIKEQEILTVTNNLSDVDGLGAISYKWLANDIDISGATGSTYTLTQSEVGKIIRVIASYTDNKGFQNTRESSATSEIVHMNHTPVISSPSSVTLTTYLDPIMQVVASDVDTEDTLTYTISGTDAGIINISNAGLLTFKSGQNPISKMNMYTVTVRVTDDVIPSKYVEQIITIKLNYPIETIKTGKSASDLFIAGYSYTDLLPYYTKTQILQSGYDMHILLAANICYLKGTKIVTDQGIVEIEKITGKNSIKGKMVRMISKTKNMDDYMVLIKKNAFYENIPSADTYVTGEHNLFMNREMVSAKLLVNGTTIRKVKMADAIVYNVMLQGEREGRMIANNLITETLNPSSPFAKALMLLNSSSLSEDEKMEYVERINKKVRSERR